MRESAPPGSGWRTSARSRRPRTSARRALIVGASGGLRPGPGRGDRRRRGERRQGRDGDTAGPVVAPSGANGKDSLAIPVGKDERQVDAHGLGGLPLPGLQGLRGRLPLDDPRADRAPASSRSSTTWPRSSTATWAAPAPARRPTPRPAPRTPGSSPRTTTCCTRTSRRRPTTPSPRTASSSSWRGKVDGLDTPAFRTCVEDGTHDSWVDKSNEAFQNGGFTGTPTVLLNGKNIYAGPDDDRRRS